MVHCETFYKNKTIKKAKKRFVLREQTTGASLIFAEVAILNEPSARWEFGNKRDRGKTFEAFAKSAVTV